jgi:hypothetical protein
MFKGSIFTFNMYCFEKYLHGLGSLFSLSTMLSELKQEKGELVDGQHVLSQPIWLNPLIKIGGNMCMNKIYSICPSARRMGSPENGN